MKLLEGLFDRMVLQRNGRGVCDALFSGTCTGTGPVLATVRRGSRSVRGYAAKRVGAARRGTFRARLRGLAAGGPYDIRLSVRDGATGKRESVEVRDVLVGDVWILAGQSNMQGDGLQSRRARPDPMVRAFYMDDRWRVAKDPIHNMNASVDKVHCDLCGGVLPPKDTLNGVGPGVAFGAEMLRRTGVPQGLLACAHGGTSMAQWDPSLKRLGGDSLYGATVRRLKKNGGKVAGVAWYQGESDAHPEGAAVYTKAMKRLIAAFRRDTADGRLPFVLVQIARVLGWPGNTVVPWNSIQDQQRLLPGLVPQTATVPAIDLRLTDCIHIEAEDQSRLGRRLAQAMDALCRGRRGGKLPIEFGRVTLGTQPGCEMGMVTVEFRNVAGKLCAGSRPTGFSFGKSPLESFIFDTRLEGNRVLLYTSLPPPLLEEQVLHYGRGTDPVCNITDEADRSLPVFGPVAVGRPRASTPFCRSFRVALLNRPFEALGGKLPAGLKWRPWESATACADGRELFAAWPQKPGCLFYRCRLRAPEAMRLVLRLGYDGPLAVWLDGKRVFDDPAGTNPGTPDKGSYRFQAAKGMHTVTLALGNQNGNAWGIYVRLTRPGKATQKLPLFIG